MMAYKKVLFISQFLPSPKRLGQTGGTISNLNLLRAVARDHDVTVLSFDPWSSAEDFEGEPFRVVRRLAPEWRAPQLIRYWLGFVRSEVAAVLSTGPTPAAVIATTSTLAAFDRCPPEARRVVVVQAYENFGFSCPWVPWRGRIALGKLAAVRRFQDPRLIRTGDAVLTNSRFMRRAVASRFRMEETRIQVLPQLCDVVPSGAEGPEGTVGFVHRGPDKGLGFVLELARRSPDLSYVIYGHDAGVPSTLPRNVEWRGWASDRSCMFASARLWIVPSLWAEPFGRVSIEAQAADRAILVADRGGLPETVSDPLYRINGFDSNRWHQRMRILLGYETEALRSNGARVRAAFSAERHDSRVAEAMSEILEERREMANV